MTELVSHVRVASARMSPVAEMQTKTVFLILADISGYTRFVRSHRCGRACAEHIVRELLEAVIDCAEPPLQLHQLLGDAAVFYAVSDGSTALTRDIFEQAQRICERFRERAGEAAGQCRGCTCHAARGAGTLKLKVILHHGEAVMARLGGIENLLGEDVTVAHRLLKNSIPADEYVLATDAFQRLLGDTVSRPSEHRRERCEGIGGVPVTVYYRRQDWPATARLRSRVTGSRRIAAERMRPAFGASRPTARHRRSAAALMTTSAGIGLTLASGGALDPLGVASANRFGIVQLLGAFLVLASLLVLERRRGTAIRAEANTFPVLAGLPRREWIRVKRHRREERLAAGPETSSAKERRSGAPAAATA